MSERGMVDMVIDKLIEQRNFTTTEKIIAEYILDPNHTIATMTSSELAKATYTSQSAVVRLYKKLGISNYRTFQAIIFKELLERQNIQEINDDKIIDDNMPLDEIVSIIATHYMNYISKTKLSIDNKQLIRLYNYINKTRNIELYSDAGGVVIIRQLANKLSRFGISSNIIFTEEDYFLRNEFTEKTAILVCLDKDNTRYENIAELLHKEGIYIFSLLVKKSKKLEIHSNDVFYLNDFHNNQGISSIIGAVYFVDIIYSIFLSRSKKTLDK